MIETVEIKVDKRDGMNRHKVPQKKWRKWSLAARKVFNETYSAMSSNQKLFLHPQHENVSKRLWKTTAWNAAWIAADALRAP